MCSNLHACDATVRQELIEAMVKHHGVCIISYETLRIYEEAIFENPFIYVVLDEAHKIKNPD